MLTVILDGNNLFHFLRFNHKDSSAPEQFFQKLELAAVSKDWQVVGVFDGPERFLPRESGPLIVRYAASRLTADTVIERMVYEAKNRLEMVVVTLDRAEGNLVLGLGGQVWSPQRLLEEMELVQ